MDKSTGEKRDVLELAFAWRQKISKLLGVMPEEARDSEMAALISYAIAFPEGFLALVDTYDVKRYLTNRP